MNQLQLVSSGCPRLHHPTTCSDRPKVETQFDVDYDIVLEFNNVPSVVVNSEQHVYRFWVDVFVTSYCNYELTISSGRCETRIDAQGFINIAENSPLLLKPTQTSVVPFRKGDSRMAKSEEPCFVLRMRRNGVFSLSFIYHSQHHLVRIKSIVVCMGA